MHRLEDEARTNHCPEGGVAIQSSTSLGGVQACRDVVSSWVVAVSAVARLRLRSSLDEFADLSNSSDSRPERTQDPHVARGLPSFSGFFGEDWVTGGCHVGGSTQRKHALHLPVPGGGVVGQQRLRAVSLPLLRPLSRHHCSASPRLTRASAGSFCWGLTGLNLPGGAGMCGGCGSAWPALLGWARCCGVAAIAPPAHRLPHSRACLGAQCSRARAARARITCGRRGVAAASKSASLGRRPSCLARWGRGLLATPRRGFTAA